MREFSDGDQLHGPDLTALIARALASGSAVLDGCNPTAGSGDEVNVGSGTITESPADASDTVSVSGDTVSLDARDTFERFDLVHIAGDGTISATTGTTELEAPDLPTGEVLVAIVRVPEDSSADSITVNDARVLTNKAIVNDLYADVIDASTMNLLDLSVDDLFTLPPKTSDPFDPDEAEVWIRTDL